MRKKLKKLLDNGIVSYENDVLKVKSQDITSINMVNMILYDDNGERNMFYDEFSAKQEVDTKSDLEQPCNVVKRSKNGIPNPISTTKEVPSKSSHKKKKKNKCKKNILQNLKNTNVKISLVELFEIFEEHRVALFELLSGIDIDTNISTSSLVGVINYFNNAITTAEDEIPSDDIIDNEKG